MIYLFIYLLIGQGIMTYVNGDVFDGYWEDDKKSGAGKFTFANGDVYGMIIVFTC